ncbi:TerD family protein [Nocardia sp. 2]|uniref:TerD family protein n=1 Tax=Nocardia acididurans TaxID=2802282 RepID=A0ABS1LZI3_9NOCA|nr:TerD family protein [Nocardia acididurans]MBL1073640.1 TerD family protein [Nocardia acididurans]
MSVNLVKGQNGPLHTTDVVVSVQVGAPADVSALLVTAQGKVRSDADFVFFNQPTGPGVRLQPAGPGEPAALSVSLAQVPPGIDQIRAVITLDQAGATFGRIAPPVAVVSDARGTRLYEYRIEDLSTESIVIALELYRRQNTWKVRAVGQGYAGGFAALVTDHGVSVDESPRPAPAYTPPPPAPPAYPPSTPAYPPSTPAYPPTTPAYPPTTPMYPPTTPAYPTQPPPNYPPQPAHPPQRHTPQPAHHTPQPAYQQPAPPPQSSGEVSLSKGRRVDLSKGQRVTLRKEGGVALTRIRMGLGWDPITRGGLFGRRAVDIDLDAWVAMFAGTQLADACYYNQLVSKDGSIRHQGDNRTGEGEGDDEVITVDLTRVPAHITSLLFVVTSYEGQTFEQVTNAYCRLVDDTTGAELARYSLTGGMPFTAMAMAEVWRVGGDWKLRAIGDGFHAKHPGEAAGQLARFVTRN